MKGFEETETQEGEEEGPKIVFTTIPMGWIVPRGEPGKSVTRRQSFPVAAVFQSSTIKQ